MVGGREQRDGYQWKLLALHGGSRVYTRPA
jgi:hypothetical protein